MNSQLLLRPMFSYSLLTIVFLLSIIVFLIFQIRKPKQEKQVPPVVVKPEPKNVLTIIEKYLNQINELKQNVDSKLITNRKAYQRLSVIIRNFIYETTSIKVQNYSLEEIKQAKMTVLTKLVAEYYAPEFSKDIEGNISSSIKKTKEVIEKWQ